MYQNQYARRVNMKTFWKVEAYLFFGAPPYLSFVSVICPYPLSVFEQLIVKTCLNKSAFFLTCSGEVPSKMSSGQTTH